MNLAIIKVTGCSSENFENAPKRYQDLVLWACPKFISTPKRYKFNNNNYITGTVNFNSNKDNFRTLSPQGRFESIVINLYPNNCGSYHFRFLHPKRYQSTNLNP